MKSHRRKLVEENNKKKVQYTRENEGKEKETDISLEKVETKLRESEEKIMAIEA